MIKYSSKGKFRELIVKETIIYQRRGLNLTIQEIVNKARSNISFNQKVSNKVKNVLRSTTPNLKKNKLSLKRYKSNFSLQRASSNLPSTIHKHGDTMSQISSLANLRSPMNSRVDKAGETMTGT